MRIFTAPDKIPSDSAGCFLGGTIDMGNSFNWQAYFLHKVKNVDRDFYNPRRPDWNNDWKNGSIQMREQIEWELAALDKSHIAIINFLPYSQSPISLLELGLYAKSGKLFVICPPEFYRYTNVQIVCEQNNVPVFKTLKDFLEVMLPSNSSK